VVKPFRQNFRNLSERKIMQLATGGLFPPFASNLPTDNNRMEYGQWSEDTQWKQVGQAKAVQHVASWHDAQGTMRPFVQCMNSDTQVPVASWSWCLSDVLDARPFEHSPHMYINQGILPFGTSKLRTPAGCPAGHDDRRNTFACTVWFTARENNLVKASRTSLMLSKTKYPLWCFYFFFRARSILLLLEKHSRNYSSEKPLEEVNHPQHACCRMYDQQGQTASGQSPP
jgi:hypothetical protein